MANLTKDFIKEKITTNRQWTERAVVVLYNRQTTDEQRASETKEKNHIGFSGPDAYILSEFARWVISGKSLTPKQLTLTQKRIGKYAGQLLKIAEVTI